MCGIAGEVRFDNSYPCQDNFQIMLDTMRKRGPDGHGIYAYNNMALGHRRLSIIDLSDQGSQPMVDNNLGLVLTFNGCIYNYPDLRAELIELGYSFFSTSDTEVILKAYDAWGEDCVSRFHGMFAFAIWERKTGKVFLARDRFGIKPLYYQAGDKFFRFASFLPSLLKMPDVDKTIDPAALQHFLSFRAIVGTHSLFNGIRKLPPATTLTITPDGKRSQKTYWQNNYLRTQEDEDRSEEEWIDLVHEGLLRAVERRLVADVPVGVLLSGGLDSSLIVGLLSELGQKGLNTFSIGFENVAETEGNEFKYSDIIADHFGTEHHKIFAEHSMLKDNLGDCIRNMSEPMVSHDVIGFFLLSREVSKHVKVVQSGQAADEVFGGYHWYPPQMDIKPEEGADVYAQHYFNMGFEDYKNAVHDDFIDTDYAMDTVRDYYDSSPAASAIDKTLDIETSLMLVDDPVKRVDNMTMAWGLEARVPFLDHELVELAARIPAKYKLAQGGKHVLKEVARRIVPHDVIDRPKGYFPVPALKYMQGEYLELARDVFDQPAARERKLFNRDYIDDLLDDPEKHVIKFGSKLWHATLLEYWMQEQGV